MGNAGPPLALWPLRYILVTANLGDAVNTWNRFLGLPEAGVSNEAVGKHISWGNDLASARSVIILTDGTAVGGGRGVLIAATTGIHELGHVHDDLARAVTFGFPQSARFSVSMTGREFCSQLAEMTWSEYAAESVAVPYLNTDTLREFMANDRSHLVAMHKELRAQIQSHKNAQIELGSLWSRAVTHVSDLFADLGRSAARFRFSDNGEHARAAFVDANGDAASRKGVVDQLFRELDALGGEHYGDWGPDPFAGLRQVIGLGFQACGFFPVHVGQNLCVMLR